MDHSLNDFFKTIKIPLKNILKHPDINLPKISGAVIMCNKIMIHTLIFMKLYLLDHYLNYNSLPTIDEHFILCCMKILCNDLDPRGRLPKPETQILKNKLTEFYINHFQPLIPKENLSYTHLGQILNYLATDILTMYENNIKLHFVEYVERIVNVAVKKKDTIKIIREMKISQKEKDQRINILYTQSRKIKNDILNVETGNYKSDPIYHSWINEVKKLILPNKSVYKKNNLYYDLQCCPFDYFPGMILMMNYAENEKQAIYNVFPMRTEVIPKHIRLDTTTLIYLLMRKELGTKNSYLRNGNMKLNEDKIWKFFFRTERKVFRMKNYQFHHMIETDGVSCSILLLRKDLVGKKLPSIIKGISNEEYIDELPNYSKLQNKKIVAIDPGKCDLIYCVDKDTKDANEFRYSQDQRRKETKKKKYAKIQLKLKEEKINGKTIIEWETELSKFNRKSLDIIKFKEYIKKKSEINNILFKFYEQYIFRKLRLQSYRNTKKSEQKMINKFKEIFGEKEEVVICFGDYEQKKHMKFKEPIKGKGMRTLFRKEGYEVYLVDEYRTSKMCSKCKIGTCEKTMVRKNPRPYREGNVKVHGLLCCKNGCGYWNRDVNGSTNIYRIAYNAINKKERPQYLLRKKVIS